MKNPFWRKPDINIGGDNRPYLRRWWIIRRNKWFNVYLHNIVRSDDDRAKHDHPWASLSFVIWGSIIEHYDDRKGRAKTRVLRAPRVVYRSATFAHRLEVIPGGNAWTLFVTAPRVREWGFHCPKRWVHWKEFTGGRKGELIGRGCGED